MRRTTSYAQNTICAACFKGGIRGKYAKRYHAGTNLVLLDPDVRKAFRDERAVNEALRLVIELRKIGGRRTRFT